MQHIGISGRGIKSGRSALEARRRSIARARQSFIASLPREGRVRRQCRRCFIAHSGKPVSMTDLRQWCFAGRERRHWHYWNIKRALRRLGAERIDRAGRAGVWAI
jgi:hypothetical protein